MPFNEATPMYKNTPYSTGIGMRLKIGVILTDRPIVKKISMWVTLCSLK
jgi:hypothetical protein